MTAAHAGRAPGWLLVIACSARKRGWVCPPAPPPVALQLALGGYPCPARDAGPRPLPAPPDAALPRPAYLVYDGPAFRVLRAAGYPWDSVGHHPQVVILSAEHGLLDPLAPILPYDRKMDIVRASSLAGITGPVLRRAAVAARVDLGAVHHVVVAGGALYRGVVASWAARGAFGPAGVHYTHGPIGAHLQQLRRWLREPGVRALAAPGSDTHASFAK